MSCTKDISLLFFLNQTKKEKRKKNVILMHNLCSSEAQDLCLFSFG